MSHNEKNIFIFAQFVSFFAFLSCSLLLQRIQVSLFFFYGLLSGMVDVYISWLVGENPRWFVFRTSINYSLPAFERPMGY